MVRSTPHLDRARELAAELDAYLELVDRDLAPFDARRLTTAQAGLIHAQLAVAEALHGVIYVGNANAV